MKNENMTDEQRVAWVLKLLDGAPHDAITEIEGAEADAKLYKARDVFTLSGPFCSALNGWTHLSDEDCTGEFISAIWIALGGTTKRDGFSDNCYEAAAAASKLARLTNNDVERLALEIGELTKKKERLVWARGVVNRRLIELNKDVASAIKKQAD